MRQPLLISIKNKNFTIGAIVLLLCILFITSCFYYLSNEIKSVKKEKSKELKSITDLKAEYIANWYKDEMYDAQIIARNLSYLIEDHNWYPFVKSNINPLLKKQLKSLQEEHGYNDIILTMPNGTPIYNAGNSSLPYNKTVKIYIEKSVMNTTTLSSDFYISYENELIIDFISPVINSSGSAIAVLVYRINANNIQFPLSDSWITSGQTIETNLLRKERDSAVYINKLQHLPNLPLQLRVSLMQKDITAAKAVSGYSGIYEGINYRGEEAFSYMCPIKETPWFILTEIDKVELFEDFYTKIAFVSLIAFLLFLFIGLSISYINTYRQKQIFQTLWQTQEEYKTTLYSIGDAVITTDKYGRVQHLNPVAEKYTGWKEKEAFKKPLDEIFYVINAETRDKVDNPVNKVLKEGVIAGLKNHSLLVARDGSEIPISDSGAPIFNKEGVVNGVVLVFRDQSEERRKQKELEQSVAFIKVVMDNLPIGIAVNTVDKEINFEYMNDNFPKIYCTSKEKLKDPDAFWESVYEDPVFREEIKNKVLKDTSLGDPEKMHWDNIPITRKGKETRIVSARNIPISDRKLHISIVWDITDQKKAEQVIRDNEQKFRSLFENHSTARLIIDPATGEIADANEAASRFYGWTIEELKKMNISQINTMQTDQILMFMKDVVSGKYENLEFKHRCKDGSIKDVEIYSSKINVSDKIFLYSIIFDITEKKIAEKQIKLLSRSIEQSPVIVVITDSEGNVEYVNPKFTKITGYTLDEMKGCNLRILKSGRHPRVFYKNMWNTLLAGQDWQGEIQNKKKNGELYWENSLISPIVDTKGNISHFVAVKEDITESKKNFEELIQAKEKAEESDRLKTAFLANMSHEIRTPLNGILGFIELLKNPDITGEQFERFNLIIKKSSDRLLSTINDIIEISKIESGAMKVNYSKLNINEILQYLYSFFKPEADLKKLTFLCSQFIPEERATITSDKDKLESILVNLIKNALKFTKLGTIEFGCQFKNQMLEFFVKDTGIGITSDKLKTVFDRFVQADGSYTRPHEGSGLGLSISKAYSEMLGGELRVESEPNKGTTFYLSIFGN